MQRMNLRQQSCTNLLATNDSKEKSSRLSGIDVPGNNSLFVQHKTKISNLTKVESESVVAKIVKKATQRISDKASAYSKHSKGSNLSP